MGKAKCTLQAAIETNAKKQGLEKIHKQKYYYHGPLTGCFKYTRNSNEMENTSFDSASECLMHCEPMMYNYYCPDKQMSVMQGNKMVKKDVCQAYMKKDQDGKKQKRAKCDDFGKE